MTRPHSTRFALSAGALAAALMANAAAAQAQDVIGRVAMEAVVSASVSSANKGDPFLIFDAISTIGVGRGWDVIARPWAKRMPGGYPLGAIVSASGAHWDVFISFSIASACTRPA